MRLLKSIRNLLGNYQLKSGIYHHYRGLQLVVPQQVANRFEQPHQCAFFPLFLGGWVRTRKRLRA